MPVASKTSRLGDLRMYKDPEELARAGALLFVDGAAEAMGTRERFRVALSVGSTPRRVYELLATPEFSNQIDWGPVDLFWGDERYVPADDRESNPNHGRIVAFLIEGTQKAQVLREVLLGPRDPERLPAQLISPCGKLLWMVDTAAADLVSHAREKRSA